MSLKSLLMPAISRRLLSPERLQAQRARAERARQRRGEPHRLLYFHQADDPYSALAAAMLPRLAQRYEVELVPHLVEPPAADAAPERERLVAWSRVDAERLARRHGLAFADGGRQPAPEALAQAHTVLAAALRDGRFVEVAPAVSQALWEGARADDLAALAPSQAPAADTEVAEALRRGSEVRRRLGHYLGATFFLAGEWYWGLDRLHHLERRLQSLGAARPGVGGLLCPPGDDLHDAVALDAPPPIDFFFSLRSPYSAIVAPRVIELARRSGAELRLRYLLPMVMRGLPVPAAKRRYIAADAAREARLRGVPFGCINDPVGRPTERGLALMALAIAQGRGEAYLLSFMRGVWAEGLDAGGDRGLRRIAERAGLDWADCRAALGDPRWRDTAAANREALFALGLWGVPSFRVGTLAVWGQDRLWAVQDELLRHRAGAGRSPSPVAESPRTTPHADLAAAPSTCRLTGEPRP